MKPSRGSYNRDKIFSMDCKTVQIGKHVQGFINYSFSLLKNIFFTYLGEHSVKMGSWTFFRADVLTSHRWKSRGKIDSINQGSVPLTLKCSDRLKWCSMRYLSIVNVHHCVVWELQSIRTQDTQTVCPSAIRQKVSQHQDQLYKVLQQLRTAVTTVPPIIILLL